ncbi:aminomethyltransferase family protein, partial [Microbacterium sp. UBA3394]
IGKATYSLVLTESGGIVDDVIVYHLDEERFLVIANAGNRDAVGSALDERLRAFPAPTPASTADESGSFAFVAGAQPRVEDVSDVSALIALQGPRAAQILADVSGLELVAPPAGRDGVPEEWAVADLGSYAARGAAFAGTTVVVCRTGYTGEDGFELLIAADAAPALWDAVLEAGEPHGLIPAGLAARDTLRLEAGMPLYGHELGRHIRPAQAGLGRVVAMGKDDFVGKAALAEAQDPAARVLVGLVSEGRRAARAGYAVLAGDDIVGEVTSGALSPTLGHPIAMAFVDPAQAEPGTALALDVRGTRIPATVTALPFYRRNR